MALRLFLEDLKLSYAHLILLGVHVGHSFINSVFYTTWLVYTYCQKVFILNLFKTIFGMKSGLVAVAGAVGSYTLHGLLI
jgi:hypothetical protein